MKFTSDQELICFSENFIERHVKRFKKDLAICLTGKVGENNRTTHAYFPALMASIGFMDFFSGLYSGNLDYPKFQELKLYARDFMPNSYTNLSLTILYQCFRHKVAHLAHPYDVLDTGKIKDFSEEPRRRIAWSVVAENLPQAIELQALEKPKLLESAPKDWGVTYDHVVQLSLPMFSDDLVESVCGHNGYLQRLKTSQDCQIKFERCMNQYFSV